MVKVVIVGSGSAGLSREVIKMQLEEKGIDADIEVVDGLDSFQVKDNRPTLENCLADICVEKHSMDFDYKKKKKPWKKARFYD